MSECPFSRDAGHIIFVYLHRAFEEEGYYADINEGFIMAFRYHMATIILPWCTVSPVTSYWTSYGLYCVHRLSPCSKTTSLIRYHTLSGTVYPRNNIL